MCLVQKSICYLVPVTGYGLPESSTLKNHFSHGFLTPCQKDVSYHIVTADRDSRKKNRCRSFFVFIVSFACYHLEFCT